MSKQKYLSAPRSHVTLNMRHAQHGHRGGVFWFTGLSGAGKSTIAHGVEKILFERGAQVIVLDGDVIRHGLCADLSFSPQGRAENIRRIAELSHIFVKQGFVCLCAFISPLKAHRKMAHDIIGDVFHEIYISCSVETCETRDVKGYYALARQGKIKEYTGISAPYEKPESAALIIDTEKMSEQQSVAQALAFIENKILL